VSARVLAAVRLLQNVLTDLRGPRARANSPAEDAFVRHFAGLDGDLDTIAMLAQTEMGIAAETVLRGEAIT